MHTLASTRTLPRYPNSACPSPAHCRATATPPFFFSHLAASFTRRPAHHPHNTSSTTATPRKRCAITRCTQCAHSRRPSLTRSLPLPKLPPTHPRPDPDSAPSAHSRGPATPYSRSPPPCAHSRYSRALSQPHLRNAFAPTPETPSNLRDFAIRTQCAHPNTISPTAHPRTTPTSRDPKTQSAPCARLHRPAAARDPPRNARNRDADAMRPSAASPDKNSGSHGRAQGRASGWPRWDPFTLVVGGGLEAALAKHLSGGCCHPLSKRPESPALCA